MLYIIEAISPLMLAEARENNKDIILNLNEIPDLFINEKEIRQLVFNLVRNGLEAMEAGGKLNCCQT